MGLAWRTVAVALAATLVGGCDRTPGPPPAARYGVQGIDVSRHQGVIDWPAVAGAGIAFAWIKATEGGDYLDPQFRRNWSGARAAGLRRGAYHFMYWCRRAEDQAAWFTANVPDDPDALPPVLDAEWNPFSLTCPGKPAPEVAAAALQVVLDAMEKAYGRVPVIYAPLDFYGAVMAGRFTRYPLWLRDLDRDPEGDYGGRRWLVWQYAETGTVPGIAGAVDLDAFAGSPAALQALRGAGPK